MFGALSEIIAVAVHWFIVSIEDLFDLALTSGRTACFYSCFASFLGNHKDGRRHQTCRVKQKTRKCQMLIQKIKKLRLIPHRQRTDHFSTTSTLYKFLPSSQRGFSMSRSVNTRLGYGVMRLKSCPFSPFI